MHDQAVSVHIVVASALWVAGGTLIALHVFGVWGTAMSHLGLYLSGIGGVLNIRLFACRASGRRERQAFDMGRECEASASPIRSLR